jgi:hypothetical protein
MRRRFVASLCLGCCLLAALAEPANAQVYREGQAVPSANGYSYAAPAFYPPYPSYAFWGWPNYTTYVPRVPVYPGFGGGPAYGNFREYRYGAVPYRSYSYPVYGTYGWIGPGPSEFLRFGGADFYGW